VHYLGAYKLRREDTHLYKSECTLSAQESKLRNEVTLQLGDFHVNFPAQENKIKWVCSAPCWRYSGQLRACAIKGRTILDSLTALQGEELCFHLDLSHLELSSSACSRTILDPPTALQRGDFSHSASSSTSCSGRVRIKIKSVYGESTIST
jgi:hypothetical protein